VGPSVVSDASVRGGVRALGVAAVVAGLAPSSSACADDVVASSSSLHAASAHAATIAAPVSFFLVPPMAMRQLLHGNLTASLRTRLPAGNLASCQTLG
jgi:hypothetical protein